MRRPGVHRLATGALLAWLPDRCGFAQLRRLQLAARAGRQAAFAFRAAKTAGLSSPATLRLHLQPAETGLDATLLKCRGARPGECVRVHMSPASSRTSEAGGRGRSGTHTASPEAPSPIIFPQHPMGPGYPLRGFRDDER